MKKYILYVLVVLLYSLSSNAQSIDDLLRYARQGLKGSARYVSMGGAFHALGGDLSAVSDNPAAAAVFLNSELGVTLNSMDNKINTNYIGENNQVDSRSTDFDQLGLVLVLNDTNGNDFVKVSFAYNYQNEQVFNNKYNAIGTNPNRGLDDYFLTFAGGIPYEDIKTYDDESISNSYRYLGENRGFSAQQAFLGFQSYMINPLVEEDSNILYETNSNPQGHPVDHDFFVTQTGTNSKHSFTLATQYKQKLYVGLNLNSYRSEFTRVDNLVENNYGVGSNFDFAEFQNELLTIGQGFSFQLGAILRASKNIRMGLSYQSPIWFNMTDELQQYIITKKNSGTDTIEPNIVNLYDYKMSTNSMYSVGLAYIFGNKGLISFQYDHANYQKNSFDIGNGDVNFMNQNKKIQSTLKSAGTLKFGGEYRINRLNLRAGYINQQTINRTSKDLNKGFSFGFGYDFGGSILNLALSKMEIQRSESMYQEGLVDPIKINIDQIQFLVSCSIRL